MKTLWELGPLDALISVSAEPGQYLRGGKFLISGGHLETVPLTVARAARVIGRNGRGHRGGQHRIGDRDR